MHLQSARTVGVILSILPEDAMTASKRVAPDSGAAAADPIRHVVHPILENRSFDQMMGSLSAIYADLDGVDPKNLHSNPDIDGHSFAQAPTTERQMPKWCNAARQPGHGRRSDCGCLRRTAAALGTGGRSAGSARDLRVLHSLRGVGDRRGDNADGG